MTLKIVSWNVRGVNNSSKRKIIKALLRSQRLDIFCLQETKMCSMSSGTVRSLGSGISLDLEALNAKGSIGGMLVVWDKRSLVLLDKEVGPHSISCRFKTTVDGFIWVFTGVYGPLSSGERNLLWDELGAIRCLWEDPWCVRGDFNTIRFERNRSGRLNQSMRRFSEVIDDHELVDLPLFGGNFT